MRKRCIRQSVLIAERIVKYHSNLTQVGPFTVENAIRRERLQEEDFRLSEYGLKRR